MKINTSETSLAAYVQGKDTSFKSRAEQAEYILSTYGPRTSNELFSIIKDTFPAEYRHNTHARLADLRDEGRVKIIGKKVCNITHKMAYVWDVVSETEQHSKKIEAISNKLKSARHLVEKLEKQLKNVQAEEIYLNEEINC